MKTWLALMILPQGPFDMLAYRSVGVIAVLCQGAHQVNRQIR
jgi:hypothetical protein